MLEALPTKEGIEKAVVVFEANGGQISGVPVYSRHNPPGHTSKGEKGRKTDRHRMGENYKRARLRQGAALLLAIAALARGPTHFGEF